MAILGNLLKNGIKLRESLEQEFSSPFDLQKSELRKLMILASQTQFGKKYEFKDILKTFPSTNFKLFYEEYKTKVPVYDYNKIYNEWWHLLQDGQKNVTWPGKVKHFALSSGTSEAASKHIPVTSRMLKAIQRTSIRQILSLSKYEHLPSYVFQSGMLMLGGSTKLNRHGSYFEGDLSGITTGQIPFWFQHFYKPGKKIAQSKNWDDKLQQITEKAHKWNIGIVAGVPAWIQILFEKIIEHHKVDNIHDIWPNLEIYVHGGVAFEPYKKGFRKLLGRDINYIDTYLASEGFVAFQAFPDRNSMRLVLNNGIFHEFVPFNEANFDSDGNLKENPETLMIDEVEEGKDYALLLSTCSGAWRYLIGDVVKFVNKAESEIIIAGRTKHFLSLCGEHLSVDNMNKAIQLVSEEMNIAVKEFTVAGIPFESLFAHHWYIGSDDAVDTQELREKLDKKLMELNDDYAVERSAALKEVYVDVLPTDTFYKWMEKNGKVGGQHKFPRVLKNEKYTDWVEFLSQSQHA